MKRQCLVLACIFSISAFGCDDDDPAPPTPTPTQDAGPTVTNTIVDVVAGNPDFSMLAAAVTKAGLQTALSGTTQLTVFAPNNAAFTDSGIMMADIDGYTAAEAAELLNYHVLPGRVAVADLAAGTRATNDGLTLFVGLNAGTVLLNGGSAVAGGANVGMQTDLEADNGLIHVIDRVLDVPTILDLVDLGGLSTLEAAVTRADTGIATGEQLAEVLDATDAFGAAGAPIGDITVFAPSNAAFTASDITDVNGVPAADLRNIILYHATAGEVKAADIPTPGLNVPSLRTVDATTVPGLTLRVEKSAMGAISINGGPPANMDVAQGANVTATNDLVASNGVVHVIDRVLTEPLNTLQAVQVDSTLQSLEDAAVGVGANVTGPLIGMAPVTLFAPTNAAFTALGTAPTGMELENTLLHHVVSEPPGRVFSDDLVDGFIKGGWVKPGTGSNYGLGVRVSTTPGTPSQINNVNIEVVDIVTKNGVIHKVAGVLQRGTIDELLSWAGNTSELKALVNASDPVNNIVGSGTTTLATILNSGMANDTAVDPDFTLFAPDNAAVTDYTATLMAAPAGDAILDLLENHLIASATVRSADLPTTGTAVSNQGLTATGPMSPTVKLSMSMRPASNITAVDIEATNGVIHIIDSVLR